MKVRQIAGMLGIPIKNVLSQWQTFYMDVAEVSTIANSREYTLTFCNEECIPNLKSIKNCVTIHPVSAHLSGNGGRLPVWA